MVTVADVLAQKPAAMHAVPPETPVQRVLEMMREHKVRSIMVLEGDALTGIVAERDCALKVLLPGLPPGTTAVRDVMTREVVTVGPGDSLERCMLEMTRRSIRHLPVREGSRVVGMISVGDVVKELMRQQEQHIRYLETYIKGHAAAY